MQNITNFDATFNVRILKKSNQCFVALVLIWSYCTVNSMHAGIHMQTEDGYINNGNVKYFCMHNLS